MDNKTVIEATAVPIEQMNLHGVLRIPAVRQVLLLVGVAASVAAGFAVVLWSQTPGYTQLYSELDTADAAEVAEALRAADIDYRLDTETGVVLVPGARLHDARLELASQGLPQGGRAGMDMLDEQSSFGVSQFMESARYQRALEQELAETIAHMGAVQDARVHLGLSRQSGFIRDSNEATASVMLTLYRGRELEANQAASIVHLVAGSVENLSPGNVTVIDQNGRMLSSAGSPLGDMQTMAQFRQTESLEERYARQIEDLLSSVVGPGRVRAKVSATLDFTVTEETRESFDPARTVVRSEKISEEQRRSAERAAQGVPGALSNQPPEAAGGSAAAAASAEVLTEPMSTARSSLRNFEMDRTISRVRLQPGRIERLSVAVLVDDSPLQADGEAAVGAQAGLSGSDIERYTALVKEAVPFDEARGDTVVIMNGTFQGGAPATEAVAPKFWEKPAVRDAAKQAVGVALVLAMAFGLVRPLLSSLLASSGPSGEFLGSGPSVVIGPGGVAQVAAGSGQLAIPAPSYDEKVAAAKNITGHDPARVAQVVRKWVSTDE